MYNLNLLPRSSTVEQGLAIGFGYQSGFSVRNMLESGLASGLTAGVMTGFGVNPAAGISTSNMMGAAKAAITVQLAEMALGMRSKFDIGQVIVETAGYGVSAKFGQTTGSMTYAKDAVRAISDNVMSSNITGHRLDLTATAAEFAGMAAQDSCQQAKDAARQQDAKANATQEDGKSDARSSVAPTKDKTTVDARGRAQAGAGSAGGGGGAGSGSGADSSMSADDDSATSPAPSRRSGNGGGSGSDRAGGGRAGGGGLFSDNPDTRSALAASSKRLATQANQSSLALRAVDFSDVVSDVHTPDAYQDAARDVLYQMTNDVVGSVTGASTSGGGSGGNAFSLINLSVGKESSSFGRTFFDGFINPLSWGGSTTQRGVEYIGAKYEPLFAKQAIDSMLSSKSLLSEAALASGDNWKLYSSSYSYYRDASRAGMFAAGARYAGSAVGVGFNALEGAVDLYKNPSERNAYRVAGGFTGAVIADIFIGTPATLAINAAAPILTPFVTVPASIIVDVAVNSAGWATGEALGGGAYSIKQWSAKEMSAAKTWIDDKANSPSHSW